jgi:tripartite-type tricarboxylate transporter receptor subunit TctC
MQRTTRISLRARLEKLLAPALAAFTCVLAGAGSAHAAWPERPITVIVPLPPGIVDSYARLVLTKASALLGQPLVVKNQAGAGQRIGTDALAKAPKDGYTIGVVTNAGVVAGPALAPSVPYDALKDFSYLAMVFEAHYLVNTHPGSGIQTLGQLVAQAKAAPGKLKFGSTGQGTGFHLATEQFLKAAGVQMLHIPYKGESPLLTDLMGGQVDMAFSSVASRSMAETGKLVMLAYTGEKRLASLPNVPTVRELGIPHASSGWLGFAAPAGLPAAVREKLTAALAAAVKDPEVVATLAKSGLEARHLAGDAFAARVRQELDEVRELNKELRITLD